MTLAKIILLVCLAPVACLAVWWLVVSAFVGAIRLISALGGGR